MNQDDPHYKKGRRQVMPSQGLRASPSFDRGSLVSALAEVDRLQNALAIAEARASTLSSELQHRVRNMLAMVRSITRQTWEEGGSQEEYAQHLQGRLNAIARHHKHLGIARSSGFDVEDIVRDELLETKLLDSQRCTIAGPPVRLYDKQAELFGVAIHELTVNSLKFGALAQQGALAIDWSVEDMRLYFRWAETGVAVASSAPRPCGFGRQLIESALPYQLGATTSFELKPGGLACSVLLPMLTVEAVPPPDPEADAGSGSQSLDQAETPP